MVNLGTGDVELKELFKIDQVLDGVFPDGVLAMSALQHGQSDLYRYDIVANNHTPLWRDGLTTCSLRFGPEARRSCSRPTVPTTPNATTDLTTPTPKRSACTWATSRTTPSP